MLQVRPFRAKIVWLCPSLRQFASSSSSVGTSLHNWIGEGRGWRVQSLLRPSCAGHGSGSGVEGNVLGEDELLRLSEMAAIDVGAYAGREDGRGMEELAKGVKTYINWMDSVNATVGRIAPQYIMVERKGASGLDEGEGSKEEDAREEGAFILTRYFDGSSGRRAHVEPNGGRVIRTC